MQHQDSTLQTAATILAPWVKASNAPEPGRMDVTIAVDDLRAAVEALEEAGWGYLAAITGLDLVEAEAIELLYHFCSGPAVLTLRMRTPRTAPSTPSICAILPAASFFERELSEMFGITVVDTPDSKRLFLADDWPAEVYPLRKDMELP